MWPQWKILNQQKKKSSPSGAFHKRRSKGDGANDKVFAFYIFDNDYYDVKRHSSLKAHHQRIDRPPRYSFMVLPLPLQFQAAPHLSFFAVQLIFLFYSSVEHYDDGKL